MSPDSATFCRRQQKIAGGQFVAGMDKRKTLLSTTLHNRTAENVASGIAMVARPRCPMPPMAVPYGE